MFDIDITLQPDDVELALVIITDPRTGFVFKKTFEWKKTSPQEAARMAVTEFEEFYGK